MELHENERLRISKILELGVALSTANTLDKILEIVLEESRLLTNADAGTLYVLEGGKLVFHQVKNNAIDTPITGPLVLPPVDLSKKNVSGYSAITGEILNIDDVYDTHDLDFTGPREYDKLSGYKSKSMLVVPINSSEGEVVGVLQLINSLNSRTGEIVSFAKDMEPLIKSLAIQAGLALSNSGLRKDKELANKFKSQLKNLFEIGIALSSEKSLDKLFEMIVDEARRCTFADAGTLYIKEDGKLHFKIMENQSLNSRMGGTSGNPITLPPVGLSKENVSAYVALTGATVNIPDVYEADGFDFTGPRRFDKATGYRSKSMLVVPMANQDGEVIGVLQLINSIDATTGKTIPFSSDYVALTQSLASQAAVAYTNAQLLKDMERLFDSFVHVMATAIDERSPYTGGHISRVAELGVLLCQVINETKEGPYADVYFSEEEIKEMSIAGWMHDIGKVTTPVHIMDKATKLEAIVDRVDFVKDRFKLIETIVEKEWLEKKLDLISKGDVDSIPEEEKNVAARIEEIRSDLDFIVASNTGGEFMTDEKVARVREIGHKTYKTSDGETRYLNDNEIDNLSIRKGTLLDSERKLMQDHVVVTIKMLEQIPFTKQLKNVPQYAGGHHECLNGTGYPKGLKGDELPLGARILNLVDFYEALTACDRPYKPPMPLEKAMKILGFEVKDGKIDKDLFDLFVKADIPGRFNKLAEKNKKQVPQDEAVSQLL